jgi:hypothetical protein
MDKIRIRFDPSDNTLVVWFDDPKMMSYLSPIEEESEGELHLIKNEAGQVIGLECQFYHLPAGSLGLETENSPLILPHS